MVRTFGEFVTGSGATGADKIVVGLIIFSIIVLIQFVVITKGATRISEVAARFTLDGMPGKQMAVDADLNAGVIDQHEAQRRRQEISQQADFFGAMDGASKFVRGDAIAGIVIILINIIGGLFIGIVSNGMSLSQAGALFTTLTIGDGLVTQVPAFLISLAAGMLVTRSNQASNLPGEFLRQLFSRPQALAVAGGFLGILIFTSLPRIPLLLLAAACVGMAVTLSRRETKVQAAQAKKQAQATRRSQQRVEDYLTVDPMELELGVGLLRLADPKRGGDLLERIARVRQTVAAEIGIILPKVRVRDNMRLGQYQYRIRIADQVVAQAAIDGTVVEPGNAIAAQLGETVRRHADELLSRDAVKHLIDQLKETSPAAVDELIPGVMKLGEVQQVLQLLLREGVPIRQLGPILETLGDCCPADQGPRPAGRARPPAACPHAVQPLPRPGRPAARGDARPGVGGADSVGRRARGGRHFDPPLARGDRRRLPRDRAGGGEAHGGGPAAGGAGQSPSPSHPQATDRRASAAACRPQPRRDHARYEDRIGGNGVGGRLADGSEAAKPQAAGRPLQRLTSAAFVPHLSSLISNPSSLIPNP